MSSRLAMLICVGVAIFLAIALPVAAQPDELHVDAGLSPDLPCYGATCFASIQAALDVAAPGATILVYPGVYAEHLTIAQPVEVRALGGPDVTTIDAQGADDAVVITADEVLLDGFGIRNAQTPARRLAGVRLIGARGVTISHNVMTDCQIGIALFDTGAGVNNTISDNAITASVTLHADRSDGVGLLAWGETIGNSDLVITGNAITGCDRQGLLVSATNHALRSSNVTIERNTVQGNGLVCNAPPDEGHGIQLAYVDDSSLSWNTVSDHGAWAAAPLYPAAGLYVYASNRLTITGNLLTHNASGIALRNGWPSGAGDPLDAAQDNQITRNQLVENYVGLHIAHDDAALRTTVAHNAFVGQTSWALHKEPDATGATLTANDNWWGRAAGPGPGEPNGVSPLVAAAPWRVALIAPLGPVWSSLRVGQVAPLNVGLWADSIYGLQFVAHYDPAPLDVAGHAWATGPWWADYIVWDGQADEIAGACAFAATQRRTNHDDNVALAGDAIVQLSFVGAAPGESVVALQSIMLADKDANAYPASDLNHLLVVQEAAGGILADATLQGRANHSGAVAYATPAGRSDTSLADGALLLTDVPVGAQTVLIEMARYLDAQRTGLVVTAGAPVDAGSVRLLAGDVNDDDIIDIADLTALGGAFGTVVDPTTTRTDLNIDGLVDILDLVLASGNYQLTSPVAW